LSYKNMGDFDLAVLAAITYLLEALILLGAPLLMLWHFFGWMRQFEGWNPEKAKDLC